MVTIKNKSEKFRFIAVGSTNTLLDFGLLFLFKYLGIPVLTSNLLSTTIAFVFSFFANKKFTFKGGGDNIKRELVLFVSVTLFGLWVIQTLIIAFLAPLLSEIFKSAGAGIFFAKIIATFVTLVWNYVLYSRFVFVNKKDNHAHRN